MANDQNGGGPRGVRVGTVVAILSPTLVSLGAVIAGIWAAAIWTEKHEGKLTMMSAQIAGIERKIDSAAPFEGRLGQLEYRLNWLDDEKNRDRNERKQIDRDIRDALEKLNNIVQRLDATVDKRRN